MKTIKIKISGKTGKTQIKTEGFKGGACKVIGESLKEKLGAHLTKEEDTEEMGLTPEQSCELESQAEQNA